MGEAGGDVEIVRDPGEKTAGTIKHNYRRTPPIFVPDTTRYGFTYKNREKKVVYKSPPKVSRRPISSNIREIT